MLLLIVTWLGRGQRRRWLMGGLLQQQQQAGGDMQCQQQQGLEGSLSHESESENTDSVNGAEGYNINIPVLSG